MLSKDAAAEEDLIVDPSTIGLNPEEEDEDEEEVIKKKYRK
jgi:hypothetical protein